MSGSTNRGTAHLRMGLASIIADHFKVYELPPLGQLDTSKNWRIWHAGGAEDGAGQSQ
ncbi:hypothetical protein FHW92_002030 [Novosphingobium sp. SG707]|nr:hypothetical protein [Novosphingobium sp. SG707]